MASNKILTPQRVEEVLVDCLFSDEEIVDGKPPKDHLRVEGIVNTYAFHPTRTMGHAEEIAQMLEQLPDPFKQSSGGGWSFLNACACKDPDNPDAPFEQLPQWTGLHRTMEQLMCLGIATGRVDYLFPRKMWSLMPGGVPFFVIKDAPDG